MQGADEPEAAESRRDEVEPDLGAILRAAREAQGLSIDDVAAELRIEAPQLRALEECRFERIGAPVFAKGYLKQYGLRLGLDYGDLLAQYYRIVDSTDVEIKATKTIKLRDERQITVWILAVLMLGLLVIALFVWWFRGSPAAMFGGTVPPAPVSTPPSAEAPVAAVPTRGPAVGGAAAEESPVPSPTRAAAVPGDAAPEPADAALEPADAGAAVEAAASETRAVPDPDGAVAADDTDVDAAAADGATPAAGAEGDDAAAAGGAVIELTFVADCWTEITDGTGERLYYRLGVAGTSAVLRGTPPFRFFLGYADGVAIVIDGEPVPVPLPSRRGERATFTIAATP